MLLTALRGLLPASKFSAHVDSKKSIKRFYLSTMTRQICFKTHIYLKPLHSVVSFATKSFLGLRRTAVEKIVIAERKNCVLLGY